MNIATKKKPHGGRRQVTAARELVAEQGQQASVRFLSKYEVIDRVGVSYPTIWFWMRGGKFPRSRELGGKAAWIESEIDAWIVSRPTKRLKGDKVEAA
jgi:predicted DNA-binding transcriptional regulator AlpA